MIVPSQLRRLRVAALTAAITLAGLSLPALAGNGFGAPIVKGATNAVHVPRQPVTVHTLRRSAILPAVHDLQAQTEQISAGEASGAHVVTLAYSPTKTYVIPVRVGSFVAFSFPHGEQPIAAPFNDMGAVQVAVHHGNGIVLVKLTGHVSVTGTIVTNRHIYYLEIQPAAPGEPWDLGVTWTPQSSSFGNWGASVQGATPMSASAAGGASAEPYGLYGGTPNFNYTISGSAPFRPLAVWDNGQFTWIQLPNNAPLPAVFADDSNGLAIVNYTVHDHGTEILVNRLMRKFVLRVGKTVVTVAANS
ncbi:MAG TPA: TrbG/VirB9 family P-type conjugative transfer protein [Rhodanobacteraceae bacterium]